VTESLAMCVIVFYWIAVSCVRKIIRFA
jgi:hypothetical protein